MANPKSAGNGQRSSVSSTFPPNDGEQILDAMTGYIRRYLVCDEHQLAVLTLWSVSAHCHHHFFSAPYLHVRSAQPHSGRSMCLTLLCDLSGADICFTGIPAAPLLHRLLQGRSLDLVESSASLPAYPVLIDDYHHSFGASERQPLVCALASGSEMAGFFSWGEEDFSLFGPKAFAGNSPLPNSLAARCIPIQLRRPKPSDTFARYWLRDNGATAKGLREQLRRWLQHASPALAQAAKNLPPHLPAALSLGQIKCAEPLVHIADVAGGAWPSKIRAALVAVFDLSEADPELQLLSDLRAIFHEKNNPEYLATGDLLSSLCALGHRPWGSWTGKSGQRLAGHLRPYGIASRRMHLSSGEDFMGYLLKDFQDAWERYLPAPSAVEFEHIEVCPAKSATSQLTA